MPAVSHKSVEMIIGKLATDEGFRRRFEAEPAAALDEVKRGGWELTAVEVEALRAIDLEAVRALARLIDARLVKVEIAAPRGQRHRGPLGPRRKERRQWTALWRS